MQTVSWRKFCGVPYRLGRMQRAQAPCVASRRSRSWADLVRVQGVVGVTGLWRVNSSSSSLHPPLVSPCCVPKRSCTLCACVALRPRLCAAPLRAQPAEHANFMMLPRRSAFLSPRRESKHPTSSRVAGVTQMAEPTRSRQCPDTKSCCRLNSASQPWQSRSTVQAYSQKAPAAVCT